MACPMCKSNQFYVKDPDDAFETYEFQISGKGVDFEDPDHQDRAAPLVDAGEIFCRRCAWHGLKTQVE